MKASDPRVFDTGIGKSPKAPGIGEPLKATLAPARTNADRAFSDAPRTPAYAPFGHFCWPELVTPDIEAAKLFYTALFNWEAVDIAIPTGNYAIFRVHGLDVAGVTQKEIGEAAVPHWDASVAVENVEESVKKVAALGGKVLTGPREIESLGRKAFVQDPCGAHFGLWQSLSHFGAGLFGWPNSLGWTGLHTWDMKAADGFYRGLFDWEPEPEGEGQLTPEVWWLDTTRVGGMRPMVGQRSEGAPSHWMNYFAVESCVASARRALAAGGEVLSGPTSFPEVGLCAVIRDPAGAVFAIIQLPQG